MKLCLITDDVPFAVEAEQAGVDRIMIDLERDGKAERQAGRRLFLSPHRANAVELVKAALGAADVVARINPLGPKSAEEIDLVVESGADFVMLPYFSGVNDVRRFIGLVRGRSGAILLVETKGAADALAPIVREPGVDEIHIGLNDLSISLGHQVIFESLCSGLIDHLAAIPRRAGVPFGFGGVARLSAVHLPVEPAVVLGEQVRLGATRAWLGRTFRGDLERSRAEGELGAEVKRIRDAVARWEGASAEAFQANRERLAVQVVQWKERLKTGTANRRMEIEPT
jgi:hypothetical protein